MLTKMIWGLIKMTLLAILVPSLIIIPEVIVFGLSSGKTMSSSSFVTDHSRWPRVDGIVRYYSGLDSEGYVDVTFDYEVEGKSYMGVQAWHGEGHKYFKGENVTVYYDPANPHISVIEPGKSQWPFETLVLAYVFGPILFFGAGLVYAGIVSWAWISTHVSHRLEAGREIAFWSWTPNWICVWRILGVAFGLVFTNHIFSHGQGFIWAFVGLFIFIPVVLAILLHASRSFQYWLGPRFH